MKLEKIIKHKRKIYFLLLILSLKLMLFPSINKLTGSAISSSDAVNTLTSFIGFVLFITFVILFTGSSSLDALIVLGKPTKKSAEIRAKKAAQVYKKRGAGIIIVSGGDTSQPPEYKHEAHMIYRGLRDYGIKPREIRIEPKAQNTLQNILYSLDKTKGTEIGIVASPEALDRALYFIKHLKARNKIPRKLRIHRFETKGEPESERRYERLASFFDSDLLRRKGKLGPVLKFLKKIAVYLTH